MSQFVDRRTNGKNKSAVNRQRFMQRYKAQIRQAVSEALNKRSIKDIEQGEKIHIPAKDLHEPHFHFGQGGQREMTHPGNREFVKGDSIKRPPKSASENQDSEASNEGQGTDSFAFEISREEFLDLFFEDLALPNLMKAKLKKMSMFKKLRAGFTTQGVPSNIHLVRSMRNAYARRIALKNPLLKQLKTLEAETQRLEEAIPPQTDELKRRHAEISQLKKRILTVPYFDPFDVRYVNRIQQEKPTTQAVMFCIMDVSGSMDEAKKDVAKRFFILLYLFLTRHYHNVELVFIRHHTTAKEVDEQEFFYSRETGGTVVSSALELMKEIIQARYSPADWNIYAAQASDGDNWNNDSPRCREILTHEIMPYLQYFAYVEIMPRQHQSLWDAYMHVKGTTKHFSMQHIESLKDIYPVFRELFKKDNARSTYESS